MRKISFLLIVFTGISYFVSAQDTGSKPSVRLISTPVEASLRGLDAISQDVAWITGSKGTYLRTIDAGSTWKHGTIVDSLDIRDVHAFDKDRAVVISSGYPATIFKTTDGGDSWKLTYISHDERVFIDAIDFWDDKNGLVFGDEIDGKFFMLLTSDGGESWEKLNTAPEAVKGEGGFAASGTNIIISPAGEILLGTTTGRLLGSKDKGRSWSSLQSPIESSKPASGIFSIAALREEKIMVGGDYTEEFNNENSAAYLGADNQWHSYKEHAPGGFRSAVTYVPDTNIVICTGPGGTDISFDLGRKWTSLSEEGFHAISFGENKNSGWMSGSGGRVSRIIWP